MDEQISKAVGGAVEALKNSGVIIHPTDTCYGLACSIFSQEAVEKLYRLKKMPTTKPVSVLVSSIPQAKEFGEWNETAEKLSAQYWPGPLTLILKRTSRVPAFLNPGISTIGIRFPAHQPTLEILQHLDHPIATTSANITGGKEPYSPAEISSELKMADYLFDSGELPHVLPSTMVDVSENLVKLLRQGPISILPTTTPHFPKKPA